MSSPDGADTSGPTGLAAALAALTAVVPGLDAPAEAAAHDSVRRLARALMKGGALTGQGELAAACGAVLAVDGPILPAAARELVGLLKRAVEDQAGRATAVVLVIENDPLIARAIESGLAGPGRRIVVAESAEAARALLRREPVNLVVLDLILPDGDGRNVLLELRSDLSTAGLPIFVLSARLGSRTKAECFALGADAYFEKPVDFVTFEVAVAASLERHYDQSQILRRDAVTGLANRAAFLQTCARLRGPGPSQASHTLAVLDFDHFQWIDETWGRQFSDQVLRKAGARLALMLRQAAVFARWDGADFIALFADQTAAETAEVMDRALAALRRIDFRRPGEGAPLSVTFSAGVVDVASGQPLDDAIAAADRLRYVAKTSGRNRVAAGAVTSPLPPRRVLLAEDDLNVVRLITKHLAREGFEVVACPDGARALEQLPGSGAALVISDIEMPNLDGLEFLQALRAHPGFLHIPVMMLTAMGDESYVVRAFELGADDYVLKPFSMREVTARVRRLLRRPSVEGVPVSN